MNKLPRSNTGRKGNRRIRRVRQRLANQLRARLEPRVEEDLPKGFEVVHKVAPRHATAILGVTSCDQDYHLVSGSDAPDPEELASALGVATTAYTPSHKIKPELDVTVILVRRVSGKIRLLSLRPKKE